jgi:hypothetical protein
MGSVIAQMLRLCVAFSVLACVLVLLALYFVSPFLIAAHVHAMLILLSIKCLSTNELYR